MPDRRVAITGLGVISSAGVGIEPFWQSLVAGEPTIRPISLFDASRYPSSVAGEVQDFSARKFVPKDYRKAVKVMARDIELAVGAADQAFRDAGITTRGLEGEMDINPKRLGCNIGAGLINCELDELAAAASSSMRDGQFDIKTWGRDGINNLTPLWLLKYLPNMLSCHVTIIHGCEGPSNCITCGDASAHLSVGESAGYVTDHIVDVVIAGGAESKLNPLGLLRQALMNRLCTDRSDINACKPFDAAHQGTILGEGGGLLVLEDLDRARARGAKVYAEIIGFGAACDPAGIDVTTPNVGNMQLAAANALQNAGISADDVDLIVTHGTGVAAEDDLEADAWTDVLGDRAAQAPAFAVTGGVGSLFAGAGGVELAAAAMALYTQTVPATCNFTSSAGRCRLNLAARSRQCDVTTAISASFTVGGQSAAIVLKRAET